MATEVGWADVRREADTVAQRLMTRRETVAVAESSAGGVIAAALLAVPGASAYFRGGAVVYTTDAKVRLLAQSQVAIGEPRAATEGHALLLARAIRDRLAATWGIGETGATGPTGNRYGDPPGHSCVAVAGPASAGPPSDGPAFGRPAPEGSASGGPADVARAETVATGAAGREGNMFAFAQAALRLLAAALG